MIIYVPGQAPLLQFSNFRSPETSVLQAFPPFFGAGLSQVLSLVRLPAPQVTEQDPQSPQDPQEPSTLLDPVENEHKSH